MKELKDGVIYVNIAGIDIQLTVETLFQIFDTISDYIESENENYEDGFDDSENAEELDLLDVYKKTLKDLKNDNSIVAFEYNPPLNQCVQDRREYVQKCLGIFENAAAAEWELGSYKGSASKIANTWDYVLDDNIPFTNSVPFDIPAKTDEFSRGQWSTSVYDLGNITFCHASKIKDLLVNDESKRSFIEAYLGY